MNRRIPFIGRIFWKVLVVVTVLLVAAWYVIPRVSDYQITPADYGGSTITAVILSYLVHLWLLPAQDSPPEDD